ncbi:putative cobalt transporter subunit CbtA [Octadecabacter antarcticus 307]|uniref:Putative cobalt transporter subunit CbtA n=1 Tax=Octadecabacter antarcticus 307 TaxID=391626 RepID=M9R8E4_9RHOB|nr:CbtA family protein [Octadecabacter antarcticus]AGI66025.1 putative cobalt transporter subunit CbtA [Octadecabacter antarcticus 307]
MSAKLLTSAVFAGVVAGLIAALLQFYFVIPTLLEGEFFESGERIHFVTDGSPQSERGSPGLGGDFGRHAMTVGFNIVTYIGFGFLLLAAMAMTEMKGFTTITARSGIIWGLGGFIAIQLAPAMGLPPVLPGTIGAEVEARQAWWLGTLIASGLGVWMIAFLRGPIALVGVVLLAAPQFIGAPQLDTYWGVAPPELSAQFVSYSLGTAAVGWTCLGFFAAWFWTRDNA